MGLKRRATKARDWAVAKQRSRALEKLRRDSSWHIGQQDGEVDVSVTSYGARLETAHLTILSIVAGTVEPHSITLWVDPGTLSSVQLPTAIRELEARGLQVREHTRRIGPHAKYFPHVSTHAPHERPLLTGDDDVLYPSTWVEQLLGAHSDAPQVIHCYRAHTFTLSANKMPAPYNSWPPRTSDEPSFATFATGVSGVIYPPEFLDYLAKGGESFMAVTPKADDVWLHFKAVESNTLVRQIASKPISFPTLPNTQAQALHRSNTGQSANDTQIAATYSKESLRRIATSTPGAPSDRAEDA